MIKVPEVVREILLSSEVALSALSGGFLNLSAYAASIQPEVERRAKKPVRTGTIVVALSRIAKSIDAQSPLLQDVQLENVAVKTGLVELTFEKTKLNRDRLQRLYEDKDFAAAEFLTVTFGVGELSIVVPENLRKAVLKLYQNQQPKFLLGNLASLTLRFNEKYIEMPNVIFSMLRPLALKRINVVEIVSTYTELTFILRERDLKVAFVTLSESLQ
jgi:hypothetical protein